MNYLRMIFPALLAARKCYCTRVEVVATLSWYHHHGDNRNLLTGECAGINDAVTGVKCCTNQCRVKEAGTKVVDVDGS